MPEFLILYTVKFNTYSYCAFKAMLGRQRSRSTSLVITIFILGCFCTRINKKTGDQDLFSTFSPSSDKKFSSCPCSYLNSQEGGLLWRQFFYWDHQLCSPNKATRSVKKKLKLLQKSPNYGMGPNFDVSAPRTFMTELVNFKIKLVSVSHR